jgi:hypothetical protein
MLKSAELIPPPNPSNKFLAVPSNSGTGHIYSCEGEDKNESEDGIPELESIPGIPN